MQRNEEPRRFCCSGNPLLLTPAEVYEIAKSTCLPFGTYELIDGIAQIYGASTIHGNYPLTSMMAAAFIAGCTYSFVKEDTSHDMRNL